MRKAFTLIELMIVIVIIGVVYTLAISKIKAPMEKKSQKPTLLTLKSYLLGFMQDGKRVSLLCDDICKECTIYQDDKKLFNIENFIDESIESYRYEFFLGAIAVPKRENCFAFSVERDGVSDQIFVLYKEKVYDYMNYFEKPKVYNSLESAIAAKERAIEAVQ